MTLISLEMECLSLLKQFEWVEDYFLIDLSMHFFRNSLLAFWGFIHCW